MFKLCARLFAVSLGSLACLGQTNTLAPQKWFSLPSPQLRLLVVNPAPTLSGCHSPSPKGFSSPETPSLGDPLSFTAVRGVPPPDQGIDPNQPATSPLSERITLTGSLTESDLRTLHILEANGYLKRPEPKSENVFVRIADEIFEPATIHIGKTTLTCSVITAIKKRNPLCLLNPMVLNLSW